MITSIMVVRLVLAGDLVNEHVHELNDAAGNEDQQVDGGHGRVSNRATWKRTKQPQVDAGLRTERKKCAKQITLYQNAPNGRVECAMKLLCPCGHLSLEG